jgi:Gpi18-like mannosyltransferase
MGLIWSVLAAIAPGFATATDAADTGLRALMKLPASIADIGMALVAVFALRERPRWAVLAGAAILLHPAVIDVSAWWGQYESIYVLSALAATVAAIRGRNGLAAALVAVSLLTKPQAIPFLVPFAAWFWATGFRRDGVRGGVRELARTGAIGVAVLVVGFLPFPAQDGPTNYLANVRYYQDEVFHVLSLRTWNPWWVFQTPVGNGSLIVDDVPIVGPISFRVVGLLATALLEFVLLLAIVRDPRPRTLVLALAASTLVFFTFMTQMHERYAYAAAIFLVLLIPEPRLRWLAVAVGAVFTVNLWWAIPPAPGFRALLPEDGLFDYVGPLVMLGWTALVVSSTHRPGGVRLTIALMRPRIATRYQCR